MSFLFFVLFPLKKAGKRQIMRQEETISVKQTQLVLVRYDLSTCNNGAAITANALCLSLAWQRQAGESGTLWSGE